MQKRYESPDKINKEAVLNYKLV